MASTNNSTKAETIVAITGVSGFIGSSLAKTLLERGFRVRGTVRSLSNETKVAHLRKLCSDAQHPLELFEADLLSAGSFDECFAGVHVVMHTASPFQLSVQDPQRDLVDPALAGTENVVKAAIATKSVRRVVLTSSMAAVCPVKPGPGVTKVDHTRFHDEATIETCPYPYSKTVAEKKGWQLIEAARDDIDMVTVNPGFVMGPVLSGRTDSESVRAITKLVDGTWAEGAPAGWSRTVDLRDVVEAHIQAGIRKEANGRYLLSLPRMNHKLQWAAAVRHAFPKAKLPAKLNGEQAETNELEIDNSKAREELAIEFHSLDDSVRDMVTSLVEFGIVKL